MRTVFFIIFLFISNCLEAQKPDMFSFNYSTRDFLPSNECYKIIQDRFGYYWIATDNGVVKYDGKNHKIFNSDNGLNDNVVLNLYEDDFGNIWCVSLNNQLSYITPKDSVKSYRFNEELKKACTESFGFKYRRLISSSMVFCKGELWIGFHEVGILHVDRNGSAEWLHGNSKASFFETKSIKGNLVYSSKAIEGKGANYCISFNEKKHTIQQDNIKAEYVFRAVQQQDGLFFLSPDQTIRYINDKEQSKFRLAGGGISIDFFDSEIWIGTLNEGVYRLGFRNQKFHLIEHYFEDLSVTSVLKSTDSSYWFTTKEQGLIYVPNLNAVSFSNKSDKSSFNDFEIIQEQIYLTDSKGKIQELSDSLVQKKEWDTYESRTLRIQENEDRFISHVGDVIYWLDGNKKLNSDLNKHPSIKLNERTVNYRFLRDKDSNIVKDFSSNTVRSFTKFEDILIARFVTGFSILNKDGECSGVFLEGERVIDISFVEKQKLFYLCTSKNTIYSFDYSSFELTKVFKDERITNISSISVSQNSLFIGAKNGLWKHNFQTNNTWSIFKEQVLKVRSDSKHSIYALTSNNLIKLNKNSSFLADTKGEIRITAIFVNDSKRDLKNLSFNENKFKFEMATVPSSPIRDNVFYYYLISNSDTIRGKGNSNYCEFLNLAPGEYKFWVLSGNQSSNYLSFTIHPPFWKSLKFIIFTALCVLFVVILVSRFLIERNKKRVLIKQRIVELESASLRAQMNPHFLFNVMNTIQSIISDRDYENAERVLSKFSVLLRNALNYSEQEKITLKLELDFIKNYFFLEQMRFENQIELELNISDDLELTNIWVPPLIIQPLIENALIHGLKKGKDENGKIRIDIYEKGEQLRIHILNTGRPLVTENLFKSDSKGIKMLESRLKVNNSKDLLKYELLANQGIYVTKFMINLTV